MLEQKRKFDPSQLIGFILIGALFLGYLYYSQKKAQEQKEWEEKNGIGKVDSSKVGHQDSVNITEINPAAPTHSEVAVDSGAAIEKIAKSNQKMNLEFINKGAQLNKVQLKEFGTYNEKTKEHSDPLYLLNNSSTFNIKLKTASGKEYNTKDLLFSSSQEKKDSTQIIKFTTAIEGGLLALTYTIMPDYELKLHLNSKGIQWQGKPRMEFAQKAFQLEKGRRQEEIYTDLHYAYDNYEETSYETKELDDDENTINWFCIKQQFFLSIIESEDGFTNSKGQVLMQEELNGLKNPHLKDFTVSANIEDDNDLDTHLNLYFLPMNMDLLSLKKYEDKEFDDLVPFDYAHSGFIGWLNKNFFFKMYEILHNWGMASGWVILIMTIVVKLLLSPVMFKQHKSSAMMRAIKPDIAIINEKYKDDPLKKQQETMALQRKAGVNMFSGCIPALLQIPLFMALFRLFPNIIQMRGEQFLWADDLTAYDSIYSWDAYIPVLSSFYGNHISLFTLLYAAALMVYSKMNSNNMQQPTQEGMPDMTKIMYIMPLFMVFFFNSYASALTWYYLVSNVINILVILFIKEYMIDEDKIHAMVMENVKNAPDKPKKKSKFQKLLDQAAEQQKLQQQQKAKNNKPSSAKKKK